MREIEYRGICLDTIRMVWGSLLQSEIDVGGNCKCTITGRFAYENAIGRSEVDPETVGQNTGLCDKYGMDVYEGDILANPKGEIGVVVWYRAGFHLKCRRKNGNILYIPLDEGFLRNKEIIGDIHQKPELIKQQ